MNDLNAAIVLHPDNPEYLCVRGFIDTFSLCSLISRRVLAELGQFVSAVDDLNAATALDEENSNYYHWRGRLKRYFQFSSVFNGRSISSNIWDLEGAVSDFETSLSIHPDPPDYVLFLWSIRCLSSRPGFPFRYRSLSDLMKL